MVAEASTGASQDCAEAGGHAGRSQTVEPSMRRESRGAFLPFCVFPTFIWWDDMWRGLGCSGMEACLLFGPDRLACRGLFSGGLLVTWDWEAAGDA